MTVLGLLVVAAFSAAAIPSEPFKMEKVNRMYSEEDRVPNKRQVTTLPEAFLPTSRFKEASVKQPLSYADKELQKVAEQNRLYGSLLNIDVTTGVKWGDYYNLGIYSFLADGSKIEKIQREKYLPELTTHSGAMVDGKYYAFTVMFGYPTYYLDVYDANTWEYLYSFYMGGYRHVPSGLAYNPVEEMGYGAVFDTDGTGMFSVLERFDLKKGLVEYVGDLVYDYEPVSIVAMSSTVDGILYGIDTKGNLYTVNAKNAVLTKIGNTGVETNTFQGTNIDNEGNFYWAAYYGDTLTVRSTLYKVDPTNAKVVKLSDLPHNEQITGMYTLSPLAKPEAPAKVENLKTNIVPGETKGTVSLTAPSSTVKGDAISGEMDVTVRLWWDEETETATIVNDSVFTMKLNPNQNYESSVINFHQSNYNISAVATSAQGKGVNSVISMFIGKDIPAEITDLVLTREENGDGKLTWTPPTKGLNGGYFDASSVTYDIVRMPDNVKVASGVTANGQYIDSTIKNVGIYYYLLTPISSGGRGIEVKSAKVGLGKASTVPYEETFENQDYFNLWKVVNANAGEGSWDMKWGYMNGSAMYKYDPKVDADDWLISPAIELKGGFVYQLSFKTWCERSSCPESLKMMIGSSDDPKDQTILVKDLPNITVTNSLPGYGSEQSGTFTVPSDGLYYIGAHCYSKADMDALYLDDIKVDIISGISTPAAVKDLTVLAGEKGAPTATVSFVAPDRTGSDEELESIDKIEIFRNGETKATTTISPAEKGKHYEWVDNNPAVDNVNTYKVVASNSNGTGFPTQASAYVGIDVPVAVDDLYISNEDGNAKLTWKAPTKGVNGGYVDSETLRYMVTRNDGEVLDSQVKGTAYLDETVSKTKQKLVFYTVRARSESGLGEGTNSNGLIFGKAYELPFNESFAGSATFTSPWTVSGLTSVGFDWKIISVTTNPDVSSQDNDGGMAQFSSYAIPKGDAAILVSPQISVKNSINPVLKFWFYHSQSTPNERNDDQIQVVVSADDAEFENVGNAIRRVAEANAWKQYSLDLSAFTACEKIRVGFKATSDYGQNMLIDNITVEASQFPKVTDLAAQVDGDKVNLSWSDPAGDFEGNFELQGYNVYCDYAKINTELVTDLSYVDSYRPGKHSYAVTTVYDKGESDYSNIVYIDNDGGVSNTGYGIRAYGVKGGILVDADADCHVEVISPMGQLIYSGDFQSGKQHIAIGSKGIYIVCVNGVISKVSVR